MLNITFTVELLEQTLRDIAAEEPDRVYIHPDWRPGERGTCAYYHPGAEPGCIFGRVIARLGGDLEEFFPGNWGDIGTHMTKWFGGDWTAYERFVRVQKSQDRGDPWGVAILELDRPTAD